eukprot:CAMPEP_0181309988 /NCGR_PEP_ID=MMETSP1101-20121128/12326_1 /TAXON_ID=46948 /ORGANISM="Rhodomonas abbreviata, Strain Caron Lab Isolate" /LENGTH=615 /DNA_ID=CAMNT_0023416547 /DNA_START=23 /DNA_END=1870 /DNA_ORIENTATION=+
MTAPEEDGNNQGDPNNSAPLPNPELLAVAAKMQEGTIESTWVLETFKNAVAKARDGTLEDQLLGLQIIETLGRADGIEPVVEEAEVLDTVLSAIGSTPKQSLQQLAALSCVANLSARSPLLRQELVNRDATKALLSITSANDMKGTEHQRPALIALINLSIEQANKATMIEQGLVEAMLDIVASEELKGMDAPVFALNVLLSLSGSPPEVVAMVLEKGLLPAIAGQATLEAGETQRSHITALQILVNLSTLRAETQIDVFNRGLAHHLLEVAKPPGTTPLKITAEHLAWALRVLVNLSQNPQLRPALADIGAVDILVGLISCPETALSEQQLIATDTIASLCKDPSAAKIIVEKGLSILVQMATSEQYLGSPVQLCACESICGLTLHSPEIRSALLEGGCAEAAIQVAGAAQVMGTVIQRPAIITMVNLAIEKEGKLRLKEKGAIPIVVGVVQAAPVKLTDIQLFALKVLASMSSCQDGEGAEMLVQMVEDKAPEALLAVASGEEYRNSDLAVAALEGVVNLCAGAGKTEMTMLDKGAGEVLIQICNTPEFEGSLLQLLALRSLTNLSMNPETKTLLSDKGITEILQKMTDNKDTLSQELLTLTEEAMKNLEINK